MRTPQPSDAHRCPWRPTSAPSTLTHGLDAIYSMLIYCRPRPPRRGLRLGRFGFTIEYTDSAANLRYYEPDFVAINDEGIHFLVETKGREDIDVAHKDRAARIWCENATLLSDVAWQYVKVPQME